MNKIEKKISPILGGLIVIILPTSIYLALLLFFSSGIQWPSWFSDSIVFLISLSFVFFYIPLWIITKIFFLNHEIFIRSWFVPTFLGASIMILIWFLLATFILRLTNKIGNQTVKTNITLISGIIGLVVGLITSNSSFSYNNDLIFFIVNIFVWVFIGIFIGWVVRKSRK